MPSLLPHQLRGKRQLAIAALRNIAKKNRRKSEGAQGYFSATLASFLPRFAFSAPARTFCSASADPDFCSFRFLANVMG